MAGGKSRPKPTAILVTGPSLSGKTTLYYTVPYPTTGSLYRGSLDFRQLKDGSVQNGTTVSMLENHGTFRLHKTGEV